MDKFFNLDKSAETRRTLHTHTGSFLKTIFLIFMLCPVSAFATDVSGGETCDNDTLGTDTGPVRLRAEYVEMPFSVTTTNLSANDTFQFSLSASGTFYVDCGDDGVLTSGAATNDVTDGYIITRTDTTNTIYTCTYSTSGAKTIQYGGTATDYNTGITSSTLTATISFATEKTANTAKIASVSGNLSTIFPYISGNAANSAPRFYNTFYHATNLTSIPATLFSGYTDASQYMFKGTFSMCAGLTSLPNGLFFPNAQSVSGAASMFSDTFAGCTGLTSLPSDLFSKITSEANSMFYNTFHDCSGLTTLPNGLFFPNAQSISGAAGMFSNTFAGCTGLTSLPSDLFSKITSEANSMFQSTFYGCSGLTTLPNGLFFPNAQSISGVMNMFKQTFYNCTSLTSIPANLFSKITSGASNMFQSTFYDCSGLTTLPNGLFFPNAQSVSGATGMFSTTFAGCTGLTTLPSDLFSKITSGANNMFAGAFSGCTNLGCETAGCETGTGYIPTTLFAGITPRGSNTTNTMLNTFLYTKLIETCPTGMVQYTTGWEGSGTWNNKVSCETAVITLNWSNYNGDAITTNTCTYGDEITLPTNPSRTGYKFIGWSIVDD